MKTPRGPSLAGALGAAAVAFLLAGCSVEHEIVAEGESEATVTIEQGLSLTLKGPLDIPDAVPVIGGLHIGEGGEFTVNIPSGTEIVLKDKINIGGGGSSESSSEIVTSDSLRQAATAKPIDPVPIDTVVLQGTVFPGSTYTWYLPDLFGVEGAEVPVTGWITAEAYENALVDDGSGSYTLRNGGLLELSYQVTGPPAVWQAPFNTPYGRITGDGTIETTFGMTFEASGPASAVTGSGTTGYVDPDGVSWEYGWAGTFPVTLTSGSGQATGTTAMAGGVDVFP